MIQLKREDNMAIWLFFNSLELEILINALKNALKREKVFIDISLDMSVISLKKKSKEIKVSVMINLGKSTMFSKEEEQVIWLFNQEDLQVAIDLLEKCKKEGHFYPAEFIRIKVPKNKKLDYIYCELRDE